MKFLMSIIFWCIRCEILTYIQFTVKYRKITARDLNQDPMAFHKYIRCCPMIYLAFMDFLFPLLGYPEQLS